MNQQANSLIEKMEQQKKKSSGPKIITVASGKGGVGKTSIAINLAIAFAKFGRDTVVMDADLGLANVNIVLGVIPKYNLYNVLKGQKTLKEIIVETPQGVKMIAGASGFYQLANLDKEQKDIFIKGLEELESSDIIVIDTGAGVSDNVLSFVCAADEVVIVTTPEPTSITDAYGIIKSIAARSPNSSLKLIVNRVNSVIEGRKVAERVINIAGQFLNMKVENLGFVYEDEIVRRAVLRQQPFYYTDPKSRPSACIEHIAQVIERIEKPDDGGGIKKFIKKVFSLYKEE
jgi:flagellar biosynthesis protein FlhG